MKHTAKITIFLLAMFIITQLIGMYVVNHYASKNNELPYGMTPPAPEKETDFYTSFLPSIIIAFVIAITILFLLTKFNAEFILKVWFFVVVVIALGLTFNSLIPDFKNSALFVLILALPLAFIKIYKRNFLVHNLTELFIYPGIAAVFVPLLNFWTVVILLILISIYDMWAVWHSGIMQKMAKYQIDKLKVFSGFFIPYVSKEVKDKLKKMKKQDLSKKKIKVNLAILGGGDVIFPIITSGVVLTMKLQNLPFGLKPFIGGLIPALFVIFGATLGLSYLFFYAEKKKFYPAMPFITLGIFLGMIISYLIF
jgi:presenilin-like A22 family membrane protease